MVGSLVISACAENLGFAEGVNECLKGLSCGILTGGMNGLKEFGADFACGAAMDAVGVDFLHSVPGASAEDRRKGLKAGGDIGEEAHLALWKPYLPCTNEKMNKYPHVKFTDALVQCGFKQNDFDLWYQKFLAWTKQNTAFLQGGAVNAGCGIAGGQLRKRFGAKVISFTGKLVARSEIAIAKVWESMGLRAAAATARESAQLLEKRFAGAALDALESAGMKVGIRTGEEGVMSVLERIGIRLGVSLLDEIPQNQTLLQEELEAAKEASAQESISANSTFNSILAKALGFGAVGCVGLLTLVACSKLGRKHVGVPADVEGLPHVHGEGFHFDQQMPVHAGGAPLHRPAPGQIQPGPRSCAQGPYMPVHGPQGAYMPTHGGQGQQ